MVPWVSSMNSLVDALRCSASRSTTGVRWNAATPTVGQGVAVDVGRPFHLTPVVDRLAEHLKASTKLFMHETSAPVLDPGEAGPTGYFWALARDDRGWRRRSTRGGLLYAPDRGGQNAEKVLARLRRHAATRWAAHTGYNRLDAPIPERRRSDPAWCIAGRMHGAS